MAKNENTSQAPVKDHLGNEYENEAALLRHYGAERK